MRLPSAASVFTVLLLMGAVAGAQRAELTPEDRILQLVVWGNYLRFDPTQYPEPLRSEVAAYLRRANAYVSARPEPTNGEMDRVRTAYVEYERRLIASTSDRRAVALAVDYVDALGPCYEWEGFSECPANEAQFADAYINQHVDSPLNQYLPLLAAHRWLCAAELFEFENKPEEVQRAKQRYAIRIAQATKSRSVVIRMAAERLAAKPTCFISR